VSRQLGRQLYKELIKLKSDNFNEFVSRFGQYRDVTSHEKYSFILQPYYETAPKKFKNRSWTGVQDIKDLGYDCILKSKGVDKDIALTSQWMTMHADSLNRFINFQNDLQEKILENKCEAALDSALEFQKRHGWSFWILETIYFLIYQVHGIEGARKFTQEIKNQANKRIVGFAASFLLERVDERYSIDAFYSRWEQAITKYVKGKESQDYYLFRAMGLTTALDTSLGNVLCHDFTGSIYDCYSSLIETAASFVAEREKRSDPVIITAMHLLRQAGIKDHRIEKIIYYLSGEWFEPEQQNYYFATKLSESLKHKISTDSIKLAELDSINKIQDIGISASDSISKLQKFAFSLRFLPVGLALNEYSSYCFSSKTERLIAQPWASLLSPTINIEETFIAPFESAWERIETLSRQEPPSALQEEALQITKIKSGLLSLSDANCVSSATLVWLAYYFIELGRHNECGEIANLLLDHGPYWRRQSAKIRLSLLCQSFRLKDALDLVSSALEENGAVSIFEYPLGVIFDGNSWDDFRQLDPKLVGLVAHYANTSLTKPDDDILYICKMACKKVFDSGERNRIFNNLDKLSKNQVDVEVAFYSLVWCAENLTFLDFKTSRELMLERLNVLRKLVQFNPDKEGAYASEIMDITLRDTLWEGLSHIEESRIFVNEAGISRWAERELKKDFDNWKELNANADQDVLIEKLLEYTHSPTSERLEEISGAELTEDNKLLLSIVERLEEKFLNDPLDGLRCYLSARIRHGTIKNSYLGPIDESGFLVVKGRLDESINRYIEPISPEDLEQTVRPALIELSNTLVSLIDEALASKIRIKSSTYPQGYIEISHDSKLFGRIAAAMGAKLEFNHFISAAFSIFWKLLEPSLHRLANFFYDDFQSKTHAVFDEAIEKIEKIGDDARPLTAALTRIKNTTCQKCAVAANWFRPGSHPTDRIFSLKETINIAVKTSKNIYGRFNADVDISGSEECLSAKVSAVGMAALVECLSTLLENCWKYSGLGDEHYNIEINIQFHYAQDVIEIVVTNPLSNERERELTSFRLNEIRGRFQVNFEAETIASEGGTGLPKVSRLTSKVNKTIYPAPLDIHVKDSRFSVVAYVPVHKRAEAYDVYNF